MKKGLLKKMYWLIVETLALSILVFIYPLIFFWQKITKQKHFGRVSNILLRKLTQKLDLSSNNDVSNTYLIEISIKNMIVKKTRTLVTIGGMAISISFIVFLASFGYGLEDVVISRVAGLQELQQAEVSPGMTDNLALTDASIETFKNIPNVTHVIPLIAVIGRVSYQNSRSDIAVYGTTSDYLNYSASKPTTGAFFNNNQLSLPIPVSPQQPEKVLGESTKEVTLPIAKSDESNGDEEKKNVTKMTITATSMKEIVVNRSVLKLLSINESSALGQELALELIVVGNLLSDPNVNIESESINYKIVGVIADEETPIIYVPFIDIRSLGVTKYSQIKVVTEKQNDLKGVRTVIESLGYGTVSVTDTVEQINSLFKNFRLIVTVLGLVALTVATLGMFNTLTISLLERTREVGLMKAIGLKSKEVKILFLTESMLMGLYGGIFGLLFGTLLGKIVNAVISSMAVSKGIGFIELSVVPLTLTFTVLVLSLLVGIVTGYYPAQRATKISALNALRYE